MFLPAFDSQKERWVSGSYASSRLRAKAVCDSKETKYSSNSRRRVNAKLLITLVCRVICNSLHVTGPRYDRPRARRFLSSCTLFKARALIDWFSENMLRINSFGIFFLTIAFGANAFDTSIFAFDSHQGYPTLGTTVTDVAGRQLLEHRVAPPDAWALGRTDEQTVKLLNRFGGTPPPLFGISSGNENQKSTIILEGLTSEIGMFNCCSSGIGNDLAQITDGA